MLIARIAPLMWFALASPRWLLLTALLVATVACEGASPIERHVDRFLREGGDGLFGPTTPIQDLTFPEAPGLVHVVVKNVEGDVRIRGTRKDASGPTTVHLRPHAIIDSNFKGTAALDEMKWSAHMKPQPDGSRILEVTIATPDPSAWFVRCEIEIDTPRLGDSTVVTDHGRVLVSDNHGGVSVKTTRGDVRVRTAWPITQPCRIETSDGDVEWIVRGESSGAFDCETIGGEMNVFARYGRWVAVHPRNDHNSLVSTLNSGTNPIVMRVTDGDIYVVIVEDPHDTGTFIRP